MKANAVVFTARDIVSYEEVTCPEPGPGDVVVRLRHSWISNGTEGSFLRGERIAGDTAYRPGDPSPFPLVAGYQKVGVLEHVGREVSGLEEGQMVFSTMSYVNDMFSDMGGHVSPAVTPAAQVWSLPQHIDPIAFSGLVLTQVGYNCGARPSLSIEDTAVVIGDGMVGLWAAQTLAWRGAKVVLAGRHQDRMMRFSEGYGRERVDVTQTDLPTYVAKHHPSGVQALVDTVGSVSAIKQLLPAMVRFGHIVSAGFYGTEDLLALQSYRDAELSIDLVSGWTRPRMDTTLELVAQGHIETLPLVTHRFPVSEATDAWRHIREKRDGALGVILDWEAI
jgi:bacteriochlorophyllide a dehydrogenase